MSLSWASEKESLNSIQEALLKFQEHHLIVYFPVIFFQVRFYYDHL
jgi:hypothetical protein